MILPLRGWQPAVTLLPLVFTPLAVLHAPSQAQAPALGSQPMVRVLLQEAPLLTITAVGGPLRLGDGQGRSLRVIAPGESIPLTTLPEGGRELWIDPLPGSGSTTLIGLKDGRYRGRLLVRREGSGLQAINHLQLESYLPSVVASEMPASWPQAALRAQAVAARTYALRQLKPAAPYDLKATVASQVYRGAGAETDSTRQAVEATRAQVLRHGNSLIEAVFHSSAGGVTENSGDLWRQQLPYLVSVPDFDEHSPVRQWEQRIDPAENRRAFPETGGLTGIEILGASGTGRIRQVRVRGPRGSLLLSGAELRNRLKLRSTLVRFELESVPLPSREQTYRPAPDPRRPVAVALVDSATGEGLAMPTLPGVSPVAPVAPPLPEEPSLPSVLAIGRGFGHGVGMSQWGAYGMARRGKGYEEILRHFYRGAQLRSEPFR